MKNKEDINQKIDAAFNSLNNIKRASPKPYLLTRINARLDKEVKSIWETIAIYISRPLVMVLGLCLIIIINVSVILTNKSSSISAAERSVSSVDDEENNVTFATIDNADIP
ncbi:MAG: hypothetical protein H7334_08505 [Ferruginibacter sp.]|nr:hypothetical protein [Ferruginibacter sp.]